MARQSNAELKPRNGHTLMISMACRISGCSKQKEMSNIDQEENGRDLVASMWDGPTEFHVIATKAKGERLDRPELQQIEAAYRSGKFDLFIYDDLSRLIRGGEAARLLGIGVDHGTRTICINDGIDTIESTWEEDALNACSENVAHNERTSKRIKQKQMARFRRFGGPTGRPVAGYDVPKGAKTYDEWQKTNSATPIIVEARAILFRANRPNFNTVADHFKEVGFPLGPSVRKKTEWDGNLVKIFLTNPILKGWPCRGKNSTRKHHESGRRISRKSDKPPVFYHAPHLAHLTEEDFDSMLALITGANAKLGRPDRNGVDPLFGVPKGSSRFPGLHAVCWYCGYHYVYRNKIDRTHVDFLGCDPWFCAKRRKFN